MASGSPAIPMGNPGDPLVFLLHGGGQTRHACGAVGRLLGEAGYFAVAFDAQRHGDSDWSPEGDYSQDASARELKCIVARWLVLLGASMGGGTSLVAIVEEQVDASALILVDIVPYTKPAGVARIHAFIQQHPERFGSLEEVGDTISRYRPTQSRGLSNKVRV